MAAWPSSADELVALQRRLAGAEPPPWQISSGAAVGGCFVCSSGAKRGHGAAGDPVWAAAAVGDAVAAVRREAGAPYEPGLLALREGAALEAAVRAPGLPVDVLLVDATGRDHPRRAGLALHLGAVLDLPTVGVTHRPLVAEGRWPDDVYGDHSPLVVDGDQVGSWLRTRTGTRPLAVHAAWRTDAATAVEVVLAALGGHRAPEPLRRARRAAREARAAEF